ncbi:MAG: RluA family pseudouridine synthase [Lysobacterales bacterium]
MSQPADFSRVQQLTVNSEQSGQRLDNFLSRVLKRAPKGLIYRIIRRGEVRVNGSRAKPVTRVTTGDIIRVPPVRLGDDEPAIFSQEKVDQLSQWVLTETDDFLAFNKPSGVAVHRGSGLNWGLIDLVRRWRPDAYLELVHRLDRQTSGCLLLARNREALARAGKWFAGDGVGKRYLALLDGQLENEQVTSSQPLSRVSAGDGRREVRADKDGKTAVSHFTRLAQANGCTLVSVTIETGRTHQIRVHAQGLGAPVIGDDKYGKRRQNGQRGRNTNAANRTMLHCYRLDIAEAALGLCAPLPNDFSAAADRLLGDPQWREIIGD